jgi:deazaflavin-dependent oxidoreductase (nitroreductase family)
METTGRVSGRRVTAAVGFVEQPNGQLLVAAGADDADWALNLRADPHCSVIIGDKHADYAALEVHDDDERGQAIRELILKYGTPAERLGRGPVFRLQPEL